MKHLNTHPILRVAALLFAFAMLLSLSACSEKPESTPLPSGYTASDEVTDLVRINVSYTNKSGNEATGDIIVRLRADIAPETVANFQKLVGEKFYDSLTFHRVYSGFMIQGGAPDGDGSGGSSKNIKGEFAANGVANDLSHERGVISMARATGYNSASSQFFIMHADNTELDGQYAAFGYVIYGMDTVDGIAGTAVKTNSSGEKSSPINPVTINFARFVTKDGETAAPTDTEEVTTEGMTEEVTAAPMTEFAEVAETTEYVCLNFAANDVTNDLSHERGVISMARATNYNSASSQFFIMHADNTQLDGQYAAFGRVVYGMDTVDGIAGTAVKYNAWSEKSLPVNTVIINSVRFVERVATEQ